MFATPALSYFLYQQGGAFSAKNREEFLQNFAALDDNDIISAAKVWSNEDDPVLRHLCSGFVNRKLFRIEISREPFDEARILSERAKVVQHLGIPDELAAYLVIAETISNHAYSNLDDNIKILDRNGEVQDISERSEILNVPVLSGQLKKFYLCTPKQQDTTQ